MYIFINILYVGGSMYYRGHPRVVLATWAFLWVMSSPCNSLGFLAPDVLLLYTCTLYRVLKNRYRPWKLCSTGNQDIFSLKALYYPNSFPPVFVLKRSMLGDDWLIKCAVLWVWRGPCLLSLDRPLKVQVLCKIFDFYLVSPFFNQNICSSSVMAKYWPLCSLWWLAHANFASVLAV